MAEAAGLVVGTIGLAGLFTSCVECIDYISLGRNYGRDYEMSMTKFMLLKARLSAWGESPLVTQEVQENAALRDRWLEEQDAVSKCLVGIKTMFEDGKQMESRYGLKPIPANQRSLSIPQGQRSNAFRQIENVFRSEIERRQENVSMSKRTRWALHDKKKFDSLIADLAFFIDGLEDLSDRLQVLGLQQRLLEVEVQTITDADSIDLMEHASNQVQALSSTQISEKEGCGRNAYGHTYLGTIIGDRAKVLNGNLGHQSQSSHLYRDTQAFNDAHVV